jgi:Tol biopolymer transport system component
MKNLGFVSLLLVCAVGLACSDAKEPEVVPPPEPPAWDGLVFLRSADDGSGADLWMARLDTGATAPLLETPTIVEAGPRWVSSILRFVYLARPIAQPEASRLALIDPTTGERVPATGDSTYKEDVPTVSLDGKRVAYSFLAPPGQVPERGVRLLDPMSGEQDGLATVRGAIAYLTHDFSPNVTSVAIQVHRAGRGDDIWQMLNKGRRRALSNNPRWNDSGPRFASGGRVVVFSRSSYTDPTKARRARALPDPLGGGDICLVQLDGAGVRCSIRTPDAREFGVVPSPTQAEMLYVRARGQEVDLFLSDLSGESERRLTETPAHERAAVWSPDGSRIAFEAMTGDERRVRVIDRQGNLLFETLGFAPSFSPVVF